MYERRFIDSCKDLNAAESIPITVLIDDSHFLPCSVSLAPFLSHSLSHSLSIPVHDTRSLPSSRRLVDDGDCIASDERT